MPQVYYNLDPLPPDIWSKRTVFLVGPSARDQDTTSYRQKFIEYLKTVEEEEKEEYVVLNPEGPNWAAGKATRFCSMGTRGFRQAPQVIVIGANNNETDLPGLTTRTEAGFLLANRRNLILWRPHDSYRTGYLQGRFDERPYLYSTTSLQAAARLVPKIWRDNKKRIKSRRGKFNCTEILPDECDYSFLETTIRRAEQENQEGAIYLYLPLFDTYNYAHVVKKIGGYQPFIQTKKYNILYKWNGPSPNMVPEPGSSIAGACGLILSPDETQCLMIYEPSKQKWGFVGGAIDRGEFDYQGLQREILEEIGVVLMLDPKKLELVGTYNQRQARTYGVFKRDDPPVYMNDHWSLYLIHMPTDTKTQIYHPHEVEKIAWFSVKDILDNQIKDLNQFNRYILMDYVQRGNKFKSNTRHANLIKFS